MVAMASAARSAVLLATMGVAAAGCGGDASPPQVRHVRKAPARAAPKPAGPQLDPAILPPRRIPRRATGPADPDARQVIRGWLRALRAGDIPKAASYFAIPSVFQNGTPVLHLDSRLEVFAVNVSFPCGAVAMKYGSAGRYTLVRFKLTERRNGECRGAVGKTTGGAIRVAHHRIKEWYRLFDPEETGPPPVHIDPGNEAA
jgi:hypothetical protein